MRKIAMVFLYAIFVFCAGAGLSNVMNDMRLASGAELIVVGSIFTCSIAALVSVYRMYKRRGWKLPFWICAAGTMSAASLGSLIYGEAQIIIAVIAGLSVLATFVLLFFLARYGLND